ncbi:DUF4134 family protein [Rhodocytophaga aerolata]|uniref:DUF4134 family protein n=1 Tax=Rhodocytophaga aerolata TaxID=455078 RepID=A0ABT8RF57_9BACT|nr:DUF4134 family protein [Rhodocytophaga aerolata]MDO1450738.1 DUF4134 family protein [Rhodocytophaga aerolata]
MEKFRSSFARRFLLLYGILTILTSGYHQVNAQFIVADVIQDINTVIQTGHQIIIDIQTVANTIQHSKFYQYLKAVSNGVKTYNKVKSIIDSEKWMVESAINNLNYLKSSKYLNPSQISGMVKMYKYFIDQSVENAKELTNILSPSFFQMSDAERIDYIDRLEARTLKTGELLSYYNTRNLTLETGQMRQVEELNRLAAHYTPMINNMPGETPVAASQKIGGFYGSIVDVLYAISALVALIGAVRVYSQFTSGSYQLYQTAAGWFGSVLLAVLITTFIKLIFFS